MNIAAAAIIIAVACVLALLLHMARHGGVWLGMHRSIGTTCPDCDGMGSTEDEEICPRCKGRRYIWTGPYR